MMSNMTEPRCLIALTLAHLRFTPGFVSSENGFVGLPMTEAHPGRIEQETREGPQSVSFQVAHGNGRYACNLQTSFPRRDKPKNTC